MKTVSAIPTSLNFTILAERHSETCELLKFPRIRQLHTANAHRAIAVLERSLPRVGELDPYLRLNFAVIVQAIMDMVIYSKKSAHGDTSEINRQGKFFFTSGRFAPFAELVGLEPEFVLEVLRKLNLLETV